jgi:hypothetical protein
MICGLGCTFGLQFGITQHSNIPYKISFYGIRDKGPAMNDVTVLGGGEGQGFYDNSTKA